MNLQRSLFLILAGLLGLAAREEQDPDPRVVKAVHDALESGKKAATDHLRAAKEAAAAEVREESERDERIERALKEYSTKNPLRVALTETLTVDGVQVTGYSGGQVTLTWPQGELQYPLDQLPDGTRGTLVSVALSKATPRDSFEMGKLLVRGKDFERAGRCFASAAQRDPSLAAIIPDVERLKRASRLFEGSYKATGPMLGLRWGFAAAAEAGDFQALRGTLAVRPGQGLEVDGATLALAAVREIPFRNRLKVSALARETEVAAHLLGIQFTKPNGGEVIVYGALATVDKSFLVIRIESGKPQEMLAPTGGGAGNRMTMDFNQGRLAFKVGDRTVWSGDEGGFTDVTVLVGAAALARPNSAPRALAQFKEVSLLGEANPQWLIKKTAGLRDAVAAELAKEYRVKGNDGDLGFLGLSVDHGLAVLPQRVRDRYAEALAKIGTLRRSQLQTDLDAAQATLDRLTTTDPELAAAWYWRGALAELAGDRRAADGFYKLSLALLPEFPEAHCARGRLQALDGKWTAAREHADRALELKPDLAEAHLLHARVRWQSRDAAAVLEGAQVARRLAPGNAELQAEAKMLANVARGPRWPRPNTHATAHYSLRSDLPPAKCRLYAEHLEGIRPHYEEVLGRGVPAGKPADVLLFESEEGYFSYNDFTAGTRLEHSLGAFTPEYGHLALFEGVDSAETLRVLSHEGFHQFLHALAPEAPTWFNEGMAEYVGAARVEKGKIVERGGVQTGRLNDLRLAVKYGWHPVPFGTIMVESQAEFYGSHASFKYAQAWSMIRYFMDGDGGQWRKLLQQYISMLLNGKSAQAAFDATFANQDLQALEAAWLLHAGLSDRPKPMKLARGIPVPLAPSAVDVMAVVAAKGISSDTWKMKEDGLRSSGPAGGFVDLGTEPPPEYDLKLTVQRVSGEGGLTIGLQGGESTFVLKLDERGLTGLEALDGKAGVNPTTVRGKLALLPAKTIVVVCSVRRTGVSVSANGDLILEWKGDLRRLSFGGGLGLPEPVKTLFLGVKGNDGFKISTITLTPVVGEPAPVEAPPSGPKVEAAPARSVAVNADLSRWILDEDRRQILALDPAGFLLQVSMTDLKVIRRIATGSEPSGLCAIPGNPRSVWIACEGSKTLVRVDLEKGEVAERIPVPVSPTQVVAVQKVLFYGSPSAVGLCGVDTSDKKDLGLLGSGTFIALAYESGRDRLWGLSPDSLTAFDASEAGVALRALTRKGLAEKDRAELLGLLRGMSKRFMLPDAPGQSAASAVIVDEANGRIYYRNVVAGIDKPEAPLGTYKSPPHRLEKDPPVAELAARTRILGQILGASPDGRWVASGTHLFDATTFEVRRELPLPTPLVAFSKDSRELWYFDWAKKAISVLQLAAK